MNAYLELYEGFKEFKKIIRESYFYNNFDSKLKNEIDLITCELNCLFEVPVLFLKEEKIIGVYNKAKDFQNFLNSNVKKEEEYSRLSEMALIGDLILFFDKITSNLFLITKE